MRADPAALLAEAIENFSDAYRKKYLTPSTDRVRASAPMRDEMGELLLALNNYRLEQARRT
jgi:hypothetical protein